MSIMSKIRVLLVDDDKESAETLAVYLREIADFDVEMCHDGQTALDRVSVSSQPYTAILLDWVLGAPLNGWEVLDKIRAHIPDQPVVVFTGQEREAGTHALRGGAYRYLNRPVDPAELITTIQDLAGQDVQLRNIALTVRRLLDWDMCLVWRWDRKDRLFRLAAWHGKSHELDDADRRHTFTKEEPTLHRLLETGYPSYLADLNQEPPCEHCKVARHHKGITLLSAPLRYRGQLTGLLDTYKCQRHEFQDLDGIKRMLLSYVDQAAEAIHSVEMLRQNQALTEVSRLLAGPFNPSGVLDLILTRGLELVNADAGCIYVKDFETNELVLETTCGVAVDEASKRLKRGKTIIDEVSEIGRTKWVPDLHAFPTQETSFCVPLSNTALGSLMAVPLRREEQTIGVLIGGSYLPHAFTEGDMGLLQSFAQLASLAINRSKLMRHMQRISEPGQQDRSQLAVTVVEALYDLTGKGVSLWLLDRKGNEMTIAAARGLSDRYRQAGRIGLQEEAAATYALHERQPVNRADISDLNEYPPFKFREKLLEEGWRSALIIPVLGPQAQPLGSLHVYGRTKGRFSDTEVDFITGFANQVVNSLEQQRAFDLQVKFSQVISALATTTSLQVDDVLSKVVLAALDLTNAESGVVHAVDPSGEHIVNSYQYPENQAQAIPRMAEASYTRWIVQNKTRKVVGDAQTDPQVNPATRAMGIKSFVGIPLMLDNKRVVGVLYVNEHQVVREFTGSELAMLQALTDGAAVALEKARLYSEERALRRQAERLRRVSGAMTSARDLTEVAAEVLDGLKDVVEYRTATMQLVSSLDKPRMLIAHRGFPQPPTNKDLLQPIQKDRLMRRVVAQKEPYISSDTSTETDFGRTPSTQNVHSWICIPLYYGDALIGLITLDHDQKEFYTSALEGLLMQFGNQAAVAIHDARLTSRLERQIQAHEMLHKVGQSLLDAPNEDVVLSQVAEAVSQTLDCRHCSIFRLEGGRLVARVVEGIRAKSIRPGRSFRFGEGIAGWVAREGKSALVLDTSQDKRFDPTWTDDPPLSLVDVPIILNERVYGVVSAEADTPSAFDEADLKLLETIAAQTSQAIQVARFKAEQNALNELDKQLLTAEL